MDLPFTVDLIFFAIEKEQEQTAWDIWLAKYPHMTKENFVDFNDFKAKLYLKQGKTTQKDRMVIQKEMLVLAALHRKGAKK